MGRSGATEEGESGRSSKGAGHSCGRTDKAGLARESGRRPASETVTPVAEDLCRGRGKSLSKLLSDRYSADFMQFLAPSEASLKSSRNFFSSARFSSYWAKKLSIALMVAGVLVCFAMFSMCIW
jgi:hypothetical protein